MITTKELRDVYLSIPEESLEEAVDMEAEGILNAKFI
jgi:hypothetical protein